MPKFTKEDIIKIVEDENIKFIRLQFTDIFGQLKNVAIMPSQLEKALNNQIMLDGSSIEGFVRIEESDQYLYPDLDTFTILPWRPQHGRVARLICDIHNPDGTPLSATPEARLKKFLKERLTWVILSTQVPSWNSFFSRQTMKENLRQKQMTKPAILT